MTGLVVGDTVTANWMPDGRFWYVRTTLTGSENVVIDPVKKTREVVATPPAEAAAPGLKADAVRAAAAGESTAKRWKPGNRGPLDMRQMSQIVCDTCRRSTSA